MLKQKRDELISYERNLSEIMLLVDQRKKEVQLKRAENERLDQNISSLEEEIDALPDMIRNQEACIERHARQSADFIAKLPSLQVKINKIEERCDELRNVVDLQLADRRTVFSTEKEEKKPPYRRNRFGFFEEKDPLSPLKLSPIQKERKLLTPKK